MQATVSVPITCLAAARRRCAAAARRPLQRLDRQVDAGRDDAAAVVAVLVDHVEGGGGAEIDDDQRRPGIAHAGADRVADAVGADLAGRSILMPRIDVGLADDQRLAVADSAAEPAQVEVGLRARRWR